MEPWYKVATPRREVREGRSFNPDEFAIALGQVVAGTSPDDYRDPRQFFARTCFTRALREHAGMVLRRLSRGRRQGRGVGRLSVRSPRGRSGARRPQGHRPRRGPLLQRRDAVRARARRTEGRGAAQRVGRRGLHRPQLATGTHGRRRLAAREPAAEFSQWLAHAPPRPGHHPARQDRRVRRQGRLRPCLRSTAGWHLRAGVVPGGRAGRRGRLRARGVPADES